MRRNAWPVRSIQELDDPGVRPEVVHCLATSKVAFVDYERVGQDFAWLRSEALPSDRSAQATTDTAALQRVDEWLVANGAVISDGQIRQCYANTRVHTNGQRMQAYRPPRYGRSVLIPIQSGGHAYGNACGVIDVKGCGVAPGIAPHLGEHGNGLITLAQAFEEYTMQRLLDAVFVHARVDVKTVPTYAILDTGFDGVLPNGTWGPAGLILRRSHKRPNGGIELPTRGSKEQIVKLSIELLLRQFGITSASYGTELLIKEENGELQCEYAGLRMLNVAQTQLRAFIQELGIEPPLRVECANVQMTTECSRRPLCADLVDFGHYEVRSRFEVPLVSMAVDRFLFWGGALWPDSSIFVQPDPRLRVSPGVAGLTAIGKDVAALVPGLDPHTEMSGAAALGIKLAVGFRRGRLGRKEVSHAISRFVTNATKAWKQ